MLPEVFRPAGEREAHPDRFTIRPDAWTIRHAGRAEDGRLYFLSDALFSDDANFVGLFLWTADGRFSEVQVSAVDRPDGIPSGQGVSAGADELIRERLAALGRVEPGPITVAPFLETVDGVEFGWRPGHYDDGTAYLNIEPGNFICYHAPWDGLEYDT